jgi:hypothetical protein
MLPCMWPPFWFPPNYFFWTFLCRKLMFLGHENFQPLFTFIFFFRDPCPWWLCRHLKIFQIFSNQPFCCLAHKKVWILSSLYEPFVSLLFIEHCLWLALWINFDQAVRLCGFWFIDMFFFILAYLQIGISMCVVGHLWFWKTFFYVFIKLSSTPDCTDGRRCLLHTIPFKSNSISSIFISLFLLDCWHLSHEDLFGSVRPLPHFCFS